MQVKPYISVNLSQPRLYLCIRAPAARPERPRHAIRQAQLAAPAAPEHDTHAQADPPRLLTFHRTMPRACGQDRSRMKCRRDLRRSCCGPGRYTSFFDAAAFAALATSTCGNKRTGWRHMGSPEGSPRAIFPKVAEIDGYAEAQRCQPCPQTCQRHNQPAHARATYEAESRNSW